MEAYLSRACWRAGGKLVAGFAVLGALVGIRIVTATPTGIEAEIAELEQFESEQAAGAASADEPAVDSQESVDRDSRSAGGMAGMMDAAFGQAVPASSDGTPSDLDRMVRCHLSDQIQFMRAADCATRGGALEELPPPKPEDPPAVQAAS